jgi:arylsulfatase
LTPCLDQLATRSKVFRRAYSTSSWTSPAVASLFTSRFQSQHRIEAFTSLLSPTELTLAEVLRERGYATGGFSANILIGAASGFTQGFDTFTTFPSGKRDRPRKLFSARPARAAAVNRAALEWLDEVRDESSDRPVFLYLHYMEPHTPYRPEPSALEQVFGEHPIPNLDAVTAAHLLGQRSPPEEEMLRNIRDAYAAEVLSLDAALAALFAELERRGILERAVVIATADHGEEFQEHGLSGHGQSLYEESIHVPLIVSWPGAAPAVVDQVVSLVDVAPSLLHWIGLEVPATMEGRTVLATTDLPGHAALSELIRPSDFRRLTQHERSIVSGPRKLIVDTDGQASLFHLSRDSGEQEGEPAEGTRAESMKQTLQALLETLGNGEGAAATRALDAELEEQLRALGYLE